MKLLLGDLRVRRAARDLFGPGAIVDEHTIRNFEQAYNCRIEYRPGFASHHVRFNSEIDFTLFVLRWS